MSMILSKDVESDVEMMKKILLFLVKGYQKIISPLFPPSCRYYPTCSNYTVQAIEKHGAFKGGIMGLARIIRCNPFIPGGVDHVPNHFTVRRNQKEKHFSGYIDINEYTPEETEQMKKRAAKLYEDYKEYAIVHESLPNAVEVLTEIVNTQEKPMNDLDEDYVQRATEMLTIPLPERPNRSSEDLSFHFLEVIRDEKSEKYFNHIHDSVLNHVLKAEPEEYAIGVFLEEELGIWETNSPELSRDFIIKQGVTEKDVEEMNINLLNYLSTIREKIDGIPVED